MVPKLQKSTRNLRNNKMQKILKIGKKYKKRKKYQNFNVLSKSSNEVTGYIIILNIYPILCYFIIIHPIFAKKYLI